MLMWIGVVYAILAYAFVGYNTIKVIVEDWSFMRNSSLCILILCILFAPLTLIGWISIAIFVTTFVKKLYPRN